MRDQIVSFETTKLAKEKGFDEESEYYFNEKGEVLYGRDYPSLQPTKLGEYWDAPTQSLLQKWLREKHYYHIIIELYLDNTYSGDVTSLKIVHAKELSKRVHHKTYEEALEEALAVVLKLIK